jgi:hypothetical protein
MKSMNVWSFCIADNNDEPDPPCGFVRAPTAAEALRLIGDPRANVYACMPDVELPPGLGPFHKRRP